jgi:hypothetical protein
MITNYWEQFYDVDPLNRCERIEAEPIFDWLNRSVPFDGSKVAWDRLYAENHQSWISDSEHFPEELLVAFCASIPAGSRVVHVGDNLSEFGIVFRSDEAFLILSCLLEIPEHHYFVAQDRSWLGAITFEGEADFALGLLGKSSG